MGSVYDFEVKKTNGEILSLKEYEGKPLVIVNTASKCGLTPQYGGLQSLYEKYKDEGLMVLGFPCDQFNNQEFDDINETTEFCQVNFGVTFPIFAKIDVNGDNADPLFTHLTTEKKGMFSKKIKWNFTKFLVNQHGEVVERYSPQTKPEKIEEDFIMKDFLSLNSQLCFAVYETAGEFNKLYTSVLQPFGLTYPQYLVLLALWEKDEVSMKELGTRLDLGTGTLTPMITRMQENGWVRKERSKEDERKVFIYLEEQAHLNQEAITKRVAEEIKLCNISLSEYGELMKRLNELHQKMKERANSSGV